MAAYIKIGNIICIPLVYHISKVDGCDHIILSILLRVIEVECSAHDISNGPITLLQYGFFPILPASIHKCILLDPMQIVPTYFSCQLIVSTT